MNQIVFGNYLLTRRIGTGGMAEVFLAKKISSASVNKPLALKRLLDRHKDDPETVRMFLNEGHLMSYIMHPNVIEVYDVGEVENSPYLVMEYIYGKDLYSVIRATQNLGISIPMDIIIYTVTEILEGLNIIHTAKDNRGQELKIIHGDINPTNIFLSYEGEVKIGDFGIAKSKFDRKEKQSNVLKGKISYLAPEQIRLEKFDHQVDLYDVGLILYEMLTLKKAFDESNDERLLNEILNKEIEDIYYNGRPVDDELKRIVLKALAKEPMQRYKTAIEFLSGINTYIHTHNIKTNYIMLKNFMRSLYSEQIESELVVNKQQNTNYSGSISLTPIAKIFVDLIKQRATGRLYVENAGIYKNIYFKDGKIYYVTSNYQPELFGEFLIRRQILRREIIEEALNICKAENMRLIDYLVIKGILTPHRLYNLLIEQISEKIYHLFTWDRGSFIYFDGEITREEALPLDLGGINFVFKCISQYLPINIVEGYIADFIFQPISINNEASFYLEQLKLNPYETKLLKIIQKNENLNGAINEAVLNYNYKKDDVIKIYFTLEIIGYLRHK